MRSVNYRTSTHTRHFIPPPTLSHLLRNNIPACYNRFHLQIATSDNGPSCLKFTQTRPCNNGPNCPRLPSPHVAIFCRLSLSISPSQTFRQHNAHIHTPSWHCLLYMYICYIRMNACAYVCMYVLGDAFLPPPSSLDTSTWPASPLSLPSPQELGSLRVGNAGARASLWPSFAVDNNKQASAFLSGHAISPLSWPLPPGRSLDYSKQTLRCPALYACLHSYCLVLLGVADREWERDRNWRGIVTCSLF